jgi:hypothetical protein
MEQDMKTLMPRIRTIDLGYDQLMIFDGGRDGRVRVLFGATWLTQEGESGDAVLRRDEELPLRDGRTLIQALEPTRVQVWSRPVQIGAALRGLLRRWVTRLHFGPAAPEPTC